MAYEISLADSLGMLNSAIQYAGAQVGAVKDKDWIAKENQKARDYQTEMWNKANEYNLKLPSLMMDAYKNAGLNPNLIYGSASNMQTSVAQSPGHSAPNMNSKDLVKYLDFMQGAMQRAMVKSQIDTNQALQTKYLSDAREADSRVSFNEANSDFLRSLKKTTDNENEWYNLSKDVKLTLLNLDTAISSGKVNLMVEQCKRLLAQTENDNKLVSLKQEATAAAIAQAWKQLALNEKELIGRLQLWAKQGNAAELAAKAQMLNAITNSKAFDLKKEAFDKFSDKQVELLKANITRMTKQNAWFDLFQEKKFSIMGSQQDQLDLQNQHMQQINDMMELKLILDFVGDVF